MSKSGWTASAYTCYFNIVVLHGPSSSRFFFPPIPSLSSLCPGLYHSRIIISTTIILFVLASNYIQYLPCIYISLRCVCVSCVCFDMYISAPLICYEVWNCISLELHLEEEARENRRKTSYCISTDNESSLFNNRPCLFFVYIVQLQWLWILFADTIVCIIWQTWPPKQCINVSKHIKPEKRKALKECIPLPNPYTPHKWV